MDAHRKEWNKQQQELRQSLNHPDDFQAAIGLFLRQHATLHAEKMSQEGLWSFEDEALEGVSEEQTRLIPPGYEHSLAWILWHMSRIEDVTMNLLVAGSPQVLREGGWPERLQISTQDTGNAMGAEAIVALSTGIDLVALQAYRLSVGRRTREIARLLRPEELKRKIDQSRLKLVLVEGAVDKSSNGLLDYWAGLTVAGLLLMPPTRHIFVHWNEALKVKQKVV